MDDQGRRQSAWDITAASLGKEYADDYYGQIGQTRTTRDEELARLEVNDMLEGTEIEALDGQDHRVHLRVKIEALLATKDGVEQGTLDLKEYTMRNLQLWQNANQHLSMLVPGDSEYEKAEAGAYRQQLQQLGELFGNGIKAIQKEQREGTAAQNGGGEGDRDLDLEAFLKEQERLNIALEADIARKDRESSAKIARDAAKEDSMAAAKLRNSR